MLKVTAMEMVAKSGEAKSCEAKSGEEKQCQGPDRAKEDRD
jgi:hypothetical protein